MIFRSNLQASFAAILIVLGIVVLAMSGCGTPNYGGVCTVNSRLLGDC